MLTYPFVYVFLGKVEQRQIVKAGSGLSLSLLVVVKGHIGGV